MSNIDFSFYFKFLIYFIICCLLLILGLNIKLDVFLTWVSLDSPTVRAFTFFLVPIDSGSSSSSQKSFRRVSLLIVHVICMVSQQSICKSLNISSNPLFCISVVCCYASVIIMTNRFHKSHFLTLKLIFFFFFFLQVPKAGENFIKLCKKGYYDGTVFHRSIRNFMVNKFLFIILKYGL